MRSIVDLKQKKLLDIMRTIQIHKPIAKPDVAARSNISTVTAHTIITELEQAGLVTPTGESKSTGGRKAVLYAPNSDFGYIIGIHHGRKRITTSIYDFSLKILYANTINSDLTQSKTVTNTIISEVERAIQSLNIVKDKVLGIGITLPGQINHTDGVVINLFSLDDWSNLPLKNIITKATGLPTCVYNDNRANIISCKWLDKIPESSISAYVCIHDGVGVGILIKGEVFSGSHSYAGELGHLDIQSKSLCQCGNKGCVESVVGTTHIIAQVQKKYKTDCSLEDSTTACVEEIIKLAKDGNYEIYQIIKDAAGSMSFVIDSVIKAYDPDKIIIYNPWLMNFEELYDEVLDNVFDRCKWLKRGTIDIELDTDNVIDSYGPASIVLENLFNFDSKSKIMLRLE
jgi:transcriptional regulator of PTS gene